MEGLRKIKNIDLPTSNVYYHDMDDSKEFTSVEGIISTEMEGESVLMHVQRGQYYSLNETGSVIWKELEKGHASFGQLTDLVMNEFEVEREQCRRDLEELLNAMADNGVVKEIT